MRLAEVLTQKGIVPVESITDALYVQDRRGESFVDVMIDSGHIAEWDLARVVVESFQLPFLLAGSYQISDEAKARNDEYGTLALLLDVDMHEVIGHASGQINPGVGTPKETLKSYAATLEEARADLVSLYFILDPKLLELGLMPSMDVAKTAYDDNIRNGLLVQLRRIEPGADIEEAHMRNRQLIAAWAYEKGREDNVIEKISRDGKTYYVIRDYDALRGLFGVTF